MITTVITSTITTITTITTTTTMIVFGVGLGVVATIALIISLSAKELATAHNGSSPRLLAKSIDVGIVPLAIAFALIVVFEFMAILA